MTEGDGGYDNDAYAPLLTQNPELETSGNMAYGVREGISSKPNPSYSVLGGMLEKGQLKEAVERERAGSHGKQVSHREEREREESVKTWEHYTYRFQIHSM